MPPLLGEHPEQLDGLDRELGEAWTRPPRFATDLLTVVVAAEVP